MKAITLAIIALAIYAGTIFMAADSLRQGAGRALVQQIERTK